VGRNIALRAAPVEPGPILRESLFQEVETLILSSATMTVGKGDFRFLRERLGVGLPTRTMDRNLLRVEAGGEGATSDGGSDTLSGALSTITETSLPSPFDYPNNTLFCVPSGLPAHDSGLSFQEATARIVREMAAITDGGIFVLFTSHSALRSVAALLRDGAGTPWPIFVHGEAPRGKLLGDFVRSGRGILLGTTSFWEGVDVPGHPLRGLILQKIPFRVPTEPIVEARMEAIEARGRSPFNAYLVPLAALRLKQGFGRLVRSREDRGAILLLDSRILTKPYGRVLRDALPDSPLIKGPWEEIRGKLEHFYSTWGGSLADG
jgi:ATP-dependent DNA helicase DinG